MSRLSATLRLDAQLQARNKVYVIIAVADHAAAQPGSKHLVANAFAARGPAPPPGTHPLQSMA